MLPQRRLAAVLYRAVVGLVIYQQDEALLCFASLGARSTVSRDATRPIRSRIAPQQDVIGVAEEAERHERKVPVGGAGKWLPQPTILALGR